MAKAAPASKENREPLRAKTNSSSPLSSSELPQLDEVYNASPFDPSVSTRYTGHDLGHPEIRRTTSEPTTRREQGLLLPDIHYPTVLDTITEVRSTAPSKTTGEASSHYRSFSLDDLKRLTRKLWKSGSSSSDLRLNCLRRASEYPKEPRALPPERSPTPPNIPRFNSPEATYYRLPPPNRTLRHVLSEPRARPHRQWIAQTSNLPRGAIMRGEDGTVVRGIWRAMPSGHTGSAGHGFTPVQAESSETNSDPLRVLAMDTEAGLRELEAQERERLRYRQAIREQKGAWIRCCETCCFCCQDDEEDEEDRVTGARTLRSLRPLQGEN